ncbi:Zona pellucida sperm-binding protein 3 [Merluccius polli]|uniref:Zona pellucida sperm-binding protein 3 n=1 Tax=Merluccius polli TaxID=89951 RepID=A0AA47M6H3_MERPO|nr:Zona pellucida sperm-binding protein 3 [Merluccius polli]
MALQLSSLPWLVGLSILLVSALTDGGSSSGKRGSPPPPLPRRFQINQIPPRVWPTPETSPRSGPPDVKTRGGGGVVVKCHADSMEVVVQADLFDTGLLVEAGHLHLGAPAPHCTALPSAEAELTIHVHLMDCGTQLSSTEETLIYSNMLFYSPEPSADGLLRLEGVAIPVECHYNKRYSVDGFAVQPNWVPFASAAAAEDHIEFRLTLMTDDWQLERESLTYFLGEPVHVEASIIVNDHMPLRIYVDHCVATATPDTDATVRYDFIERHGCLMDAYLTDSGSQYLPRVQEDKLRFQLDAFRFYQESTGLIYISCRLKAVAAASAVCALNRACSFIYNRWQSVDGNDPACASCEVNQQFLAETIKPTPPPSPPPALMTNMEPPTRQAGTPQTEAKRAPASYFHFRPHSHLAPPSSSLGSKKRGANSGAEWTKTISSGPLVILPSNVATKPANFAASLPPTTAPHQHAESGPLEKSNSSTTVPSNPEDAYSAPPHDTSIFTKHLQKQNGHE